MRTGPRCSPPSPPPSNRGRRGWRRGCPDAPNRWPGASSSRPQWSDHQAWSSPAAPSPSHTGTRSSAQTSPSHRSHRSRTTPPSGCRTTPAPRAPPPSQPQPEPAPPPREPRRHPHPDTHPPQRPAPQQPPDDAPQSLRFHRFRHCSFPQKRCCFDDDIVLFSFPWAPSYKITAWCIIPLKDEMARRLSPHRLGCLQHSQEAPDPRTRPTSRSDRARPP